MENNKQKLIENLKKEIDYINSDLVQFNATFNFIGQNIKQLEEELVLARQIHEMYYPEF